MIYQTLRDGLIYAQLDAAALSGLALGAGLGLLALALALAASARFAASACAFVRLSPRAGDAWLSVCVSLSASFY